MRPAYVDRALNARRAGDPVYAVLEVVCGLMGLDPESTFHARRGTPQSRARAITCYLALKMLEMTPYRLSLESGWNARTIKCAAMLVEARLKTGDAPGLTATVDTAGEILIPVLWEEVA